MEDAIIFLVPVGLEVGDEEVDMGAERGGGEEKGDDDVVYVVEEVAGEAASGEEEGGGGVVGSARRGSGGAGEEGDRGGTGDGIGVHFTRVGMEGEVVGSGGREALAGG